MPKNQNQQKKRRNPCQNNNALHFSRFLRTIRLLYVFVRFFDLHNRLLHVVVDSIQDRALIDDQIGQIFEEGVQLQNRLADLDYLAFSFVDHLEIVE